MPLVTLASNHPEHESGGIAMTLFNGFRRANQTWVSAWTLLLAAALLAFGSMALAKPNPKAEPQVFVSEVVDDLIGAIQSRVAQKPLTTSEIHEIVNQY